MIFSNYVITGITSFIANHEICVYEQGLGERSTEIAAAMKRFNPDENELEISGRSGKRSQAGLI